MEVGDIIASGHEEMNIVLKERAEVRAGLPISDDGDPQLWLRIGFDAIGRGGNRAGADGVE